MQLRDTKQNWRAGDRAGRPLGLGALTARLERTPARRKPADDVNPAKSTQPGIKYHLPGTPEPFLRRKKMRGMTLQMRFEHERPQDLGPFDDFIETGPMAACVSVIVGWNSISGEMTNMRGFHGAGGIENVNFGELLEGVDNDVRTKVWMISGADNNSNSCVETNNTTILQEVRSRLGAVLQILPIHIVQNARVYRNGRVDVYRRNGRVVIF